MIRVNQPEQARGQDVAEFLEPGTIRNGERPIRQLSDGAADCDFA
jgi:hypothetical protein